MSCLSGLIPTNIERSIRQKLLKVRSYEEFELARDLNNAHEFIEDGRDCRKEDIDIACPWYSPVTIHEELSRKAPTLSAFLKSSLLPTPSKRKPKRSVRIVDKDNSTLVLDEANVDDHHHKFQIDKCSNSHDCISSMTFDINKLKECSAALDGSYNLRSISASKTTRKSATSFVENIDLEREQFRERLRKERELRFHSLRISLQSVTQEQLEGRKVGSVNEACIVRDCKLRFAKITRILARNTLSSSGSRKQIIPLHNYLNHIENILKIYKKQLNEEIQQELANDTDMYVTKIMNEFGYINSMVKKDNSGLCRKGSARSRVQIEKLNALCEYILKSFNFESQDKGNSGINSCIIRQQEIGSYLQSRLSHSS